MTVTVGIDEVGRGCLAGPVVACSVYFGGSDNYPDEWDYLKLHLNDSKKLSKSKLAKINHVLINSPFVHYRLSARSAPVVDSVNILQATFQCFRSVARDGDFYHIIDGNMYPISQPGRSVIKADGEFMECMAASIIAKVFRDKLMSRLALRYPFYKWESTAGYGTKAHMDGIQRYVLTGHHRRSVIKGV